MNSRWWIVAMIAGMAGIAVLDRLVSEIQQVIVALSALCGGGAALVMLHWRRKVIRELNGLADRLPVDMAKTVAGKAGHAGRFERFVRRHVVAP